MSTLDYHLREFAIASDRLDPKRIMPSFAARHKTVLDIGCGMGQTLIASGLASDAILHGIDTDASAIEAGRSLCQSNVHLSVGSGENLAFEGEMFDIVVCRVALPYMDVCTALKEMRRVLKPGGDMWLVLHPVKMYRNRAAKSLLAGRLKDVVYCSYVLLNGLLQHSTGKQVRFGGRTETYQTARSISSDLKRAGFTDIRVTLSHHFLVEASKMN